MVHAIKLTWKLGLGYVNEKYAARLHAALELGYLCGSLLFTVGTVFFFPAEGLEDFVLGCRLYEVGSVIFTVLTFYCQLDRFYARRKGLHQRSDDSSTNDSSEVGHIIPIISRRELLEEMMYCLGSFVFLVGTFLFDPPFVENIAQTFQIPKSNVENTAAVCFMIGSFMFALGSYVNALSIYEAPKAFRNLLMTVTTCYQFGGLLFIGGTMGYVEAFEPNLKLRWVATWFYMVGCLFYVSGSFMSFVGTVANNQVRWERLKNQEKKKRRPVAKLVAHAIPRVLKAAVRRKRAKPHSPVRRRSPTASQESGGNLDLDLEAFDEDDDISMEDLAKIAETAETMEGLDLEVAEGRLAEQLAAVLGPEAGSELAAALRDDEDGLLEEEDIFPAFWRSVWTTPSSRPAAAGPSAAVVGAEDDSRDGAFVEQPSTTLTSKDNLSLVQNRVD